MKEIEIGFKKAGNEMLDYISFKDDSSEQRTYYKDEVVKLNLNGDKVDVMLSDLFSAIGEAKASGEFWLDEIDGRIAELLIENEELKNKLDYYQELIDSKGRL
jgi:ethanolamine utilization protein EutA (predicted chaperonin)